MARKDLSNSTRFWLDRSVPGLSLMQAALTTHEYPPHRHDELVIAVTEDGGSIVESQGFTEEASPETLLVFNANEVQAGRMGRSCGWRYRSFYLEQPALATIQAGLGVEGPVFFGQVALRDRALVQSFLQLHHTLESQSDPLLSQERLISAFGMLYQKSSRTRAHPHSPNFPRDQALLKKAVEIVHSNLDAIPSVEWIASQLTLSQYQLVQLFKRTIGMTPHAYIIQARVENAKRDLGRGLPISDVALKSGFYDQAALTKYFKRTLGMTPLQYSQAKTERRIPDQRQGSRHLPDCREYQSRGDRGYDLVAGLS